MHLWALLQLILKIDAFYCSNYSSVELMQSETNINNNKKSNQIIAQLCSNPSPGFRIIKYQSVCVLISYRPFCCFLQPQACLQQTASAQLLPLLGPLLPMCMGCSLHSQAFSWDKSRRLAWVLYSLGFIMAAFFPEPLALSEIASFAHTLNITWHTSWHSKAESLEPC